MVKITADDWGLSKEINQAILQLAQKNKLHYVSVMAGSEHFEFLLEELLKTQVNFSLHLNFTEGNSLSGTESPYLFHGPRRYFFGAMLGLIANEKLVEEATLQIEKAKKILSHRLIRIDGHHHAHLAPGMLVKIQKILFENQILEIRLPSDVNHPGSFLLSCVFKITKGIFKEFKLIPYGYYHCGIKNYRFENYLAHPGVDNGLHDGWSQRRIAEYRGLMES